jgi:hypothetical protein
MPQQENRDINLVVDKPLQLSMEGALAHEFRIRPVHGREAIESHNDAPIAGGQRAGSALKLCGKKFDEWRVKS